MPTSLKSYQEAFLHYLHDIRGYSPHTIKSYKTRLNSMRESSHFHQEGNTARLDITPFRLAIAHKHKRTIAAALCAVGSFVRYLQEQQRLSIELIGAQKIKVPQTLPKPIEESYIQEVLQHASLESRLLITMLYGLGLRISELSHVKLEDMRGEWISVRGKGDKLRELPLLPPIIRLIERYRTTALPKCYLFEKRGVRRNSAQLRYQLTQCFKALGIEATPHQLRHSFASHLLNNGARISDISELLGHATMASTQVYTKLESSKKLQAYRQAHPLNHLH